MELDLAQVGPGSFIRLARQDTVHGTLAKSRTCDCCLHMRGSWKVCLQNEKDSGADREVIYRLSAYSSNHVDKKQSITIPFSPPKA